jgi:hypothetical protein
MRPPALDAVSVIGTLPPLRTPRIELDGVYAAVEAASGWAWGNGATLPACDVIPSGAPTVVNAVMVRACLSTMPARAH